MQHHLMVNKAFLTMVLQLQMKSSGMKTQAQLVLQSFHSVVTNPSSPTLNYSSGIPHYTQASANNLLMF